MWWAFFFIPILHAMCYVPHLVLVQRERRCHTKRLVDYVILGVMCEIGSANIFDLRSILSKLGFEFRYDKFVREYLCYIPLKHRFILLPLLGQKDRL
jgi:hypothetical protein